MRFGQKEFLLETMKYNFNSILDIGLGAGEASDFFLSKGKKVSATGFDTNNYFLSQNVRDNVKIFDGLSVENMEEIKSNSFDAVWCAHVLEHVQNAGLALSEIHRVLKMQGLLFISVPKYDTHIVGGHINTGWNIGTLIYNLLLAGFDVKKGSFIEYGGHICGFVKKANLKLPPLRYDNGDIETLKDFFPKEIFHGVDSDFGQINWKWEIATPSKKFIFVSMTMRFFRRNFKKFKKKISNLVF